MDSSAFFVAGSKRRIGRACFRSQNRNVARRCSMTAPLTVIAFFAASNPACVKSLEQLYALTEKSGERLRVILVTRDDDAKISPVVTPYLSPRFTVAFDTDGKIFKNFGVNYVPFSLLTDARNRVLWQGNSLHLTDKIVSSAQ